MAKTRIQVKNGAVTLPTGFAVDAQSMRLRESQASENTTTYGASIYAQMTGNGTPIQQVTVVGFPFKGVASSNPGIGAMATAGADIGSAGTFTLDTGCASAGPYICTDLDIEHSRITAAARTTLTFVTAGDPTITWAVS